MKIRMLTAMVLFFFTATLAMAGPDDNEDALYPFPPGPNAALTKQVCTSCHGANVVVRRRYDKTEATRMYRLMVGQASASAKLNDEEQSAKIIQYLSTVLGDN